MREIVERGDLAMVHGQSYLVAPVSAPTIDVVSAFEAEAEDREEDGSNEPEESDREHDGARLEWQVRATSACKYTLAFGGVCSVAGTSCARAPAASFPRVPR